jgi:hypothetical protein
MTGLFMKHSLMLIGLLLSPAFARASLTELCVVKISPCHVLSQMDTREVILESYNGITRSEPAFQAAAVFTYTFRQTRGYSGGFSGGYSKVRFEHEESDSAWFGSATEAQNDALTKCSEQREETVEAMPSCGSKLE